MANELSGNALRFTFLESVYEATGGDPLEMVHLDLVCEQLGMGRETSELAMRWLVNELLLKYATFGPTLSITHAGVRVVEEAREHRDQAILPFPAYNEMFRQAEPNSSDVSGGEQEQEPVRQRPEAGLSSSEADRSDAADEPVLDSELDEHEPEARTSGVSADVLLQEQVAIPLRTNPDVLAPDDNLGFTPYVDAVASFLMSPDTQPPLTLSVEGEWGKGKSSFMAQLRKRIEQEGAKRDKASQHLCVEFNPWRHSKDEELWSSFVLDFTDQLSKQLSPCEKAKARSALFIRRIKRPENRCALARAIATVVGFVAATAGSLLLLRFLGPGWIDAVTAVAGTSSATMLRVLEAGGTAGLIFFAVLLGTRLMPSVTRALSFDIRAHLSVPDYAGRIPFVQRFHQDFKAILRTHTAGQRVFLFIDDVDRCAPPRAADLMRAINLLIPENNRLVFVLGIDRAKVAAGMAASYKTLLPYLAADVHPGSSGNSSEACAGLEFGRRFVEKFVQLPFAVPTPDREDLEAYVRYLGEHQQTQTAQRVPDSTGGDLYEPSERTQEEQRRDAHTVHLAPEDSPMIQRVALMLSSVLGGNPRRVKQFLNLLRLRVYIGHATRMFEGTEMSKSWSVPQLGKLIALELLEPTLLMSFDRDPELLGRLEDTAIYDGANSEDSSSGLASWLKSRPRLRDLLRLGCFDDEWQDEFSKEQCSFQGLDLSRALRTAPRVREFPVDRPEPKIVRKHIAANVSLSGTVQADVKRINVSDEGRGHDSVSVERSEAPQSNSASAEERGETTRMRRQGIPITGYGGSTSFARRVLPPRRIANWWQIRALIPAVGTDFEEVVGRYATEERAMEVFSAFEAWNLAREQNPSPRVRPFQFPPS